MERWYRRALGFDWSVGETPKKKMDTEKRCLLGEDLVPVSKDKLKVFGKKSAWSGCFIQKAIAVDVAVYAESRNQ